MNGATPLGTRAVERLLRRQYNTQGAVAAALGVAGDLQVSVEGRAVKPEDAALFNEVPFTCVVNQSAVAGQRGIGMIQADTLGTFDIVIEEVCVTGDSWTLRVGNTATFGAITTGMNVLALDSYYGELGATVIASPGIVTGSLTSAAPAGVVVGQTLASQGCWTRPIVIRAVPGQGANNSVVAVVGATANTFLSGWFSGRLVPVNIGS